jgi:hypothetical protein
MPVPEWTWREPSAAQPKNVFGHPPLTTRYHFRALDHSGRVQWDHWLDDRMEADDLLWHIARGWRPDVDDFASLEFVTTVFITAGASWSIPADCTGVSGVAGEFIDAIGAGASGAVAYIAPNMATGGGGGAHSRVTTGVTLTPGGSATIQIGVGGVAVVRTGVGATAGNAGTDTWFNGASLAASSVGAKAGNGGLTGSSTTVAGGEGGLASAGIGTTKVDGGDGGDTASAAHVNSTTGGGGAGGPNGAGNNGVDTTGSAQGTTGGSGGAAGAGASGSSGSPIVATAGSPGTEYTGGAHGSGGGGGGARNSSSGGATAGSGGNYGAGGGGAWPASGGTATSGAGIQGLIVVAYNPAAAGGGKLALNMPMLGM